MFRGIVILLLAICIAGGVAYYNGWLAEYIGDIGEPSASLVPSGQTGNAKVDLGKLLYAPVPLAELPATQPGTTKQLVIEPCHVVPGETQAVSYKREGVLAFVGEDVTDKPPAPADPSRPVILVPIFDGEKVLTRKFRPLFEGDIVEPGQIVAVVHPAMASHDIQSKQFKLIAALADFRSAEEILKETQKRRDKLYYLRQGGNGIVSELEIGEAEVAVAKYNGEKITKEAAIDIAKSDLAQAKLVLSEHFLESKLTGKARVKKIYKFAGEGIKPQETVLELQNISQLRVEGAVESQYFHELQANKNALCYLEPSVELAPKLELMKAHTGEVTSVAFCADGEHFVSGSDDNTVCVWRRGLVAPVLTLPHDSAVRTVACSPKGMWLVVGCADGTLTRWDLTRPKEPVKFKGQHHGAVTALAFSPDGAYVASGGVDYAIMLWKTASGEVFYPFDAEHGVDDPHQGTITSLAFTPQCKLVSAARDYTLRVWTLHQKGAELERKPLAFRGGTVGLLGVSADGRYMLFDKGRTLQLRNVADQSTVCVLDNLAGSNPFDTLALFSPDGSLMLTGGAGEGRLQLWKTPTPEERAFQLRELVTKDRAAITSAAFAPGGRRFAVTGSKDGYVHMWALPDKTAVDNHRIFKDADNQPLRVGLVERELSASKNRIVVYVLNPEERLVQGQRVTLVVVLPLETR